MLFNALKLTQKTLPLIADTGDLSPERLQEILDQDNTVPCYLIINPERTDLYWYEEDYFKAHCKFVDAELEDQFAEVVFI